MLIVVQVFGFLHGMKQEVDFIQMFQKLELLKLLGGTQKDMISQSRNAYGLTRAYMLTGNNDYLDLADKALKIYV